MERTGWIVIAMLCAAPAWANMGGAADDSSQDSAAEQGRRAVEAKDYAQAVMLLERAAAAEPKNADVQNWLGFAHRNLGNYELAFKYYEQAILLSPGHKAAREYMGEAYLLTGNLSRAEAQLAELGRICTAGCEEQKQLRASIDSFRRKNNK